MDGDVIIFHKSNKNHDHMLCCSWNIACDRCNCHFSFVIIFYPFTPTWKMKISEKWKKCLEISSFYIRVPKIMIICYTVPEIWHVMNVNVIFHFGLLFTLLPPLPPPLPTAWKMKNSKKEKKHQEISSFYTSVPKIMIICTKSHDYNAILFLRYGTWQM